MNFKKIAAGVLAIGACLASFSSFQAGAHHAFGAEFDFSADCFPVTLFSAGGFSSLAALGGVRFSVEAAGVG